MGRNERYSSNLLLLWKCWRPECGQRGAPAATYWFKIIVMCTLESYLRRPWPWNIPNKISRGEISLKAIWMWICFQIQVGVCILGLSHKCLCEKNNSDFGQLCLKERTQMKGLVRQGSAGCLGSRQRDPTRALQAPYLLFHQLLWPSRRWGAWRTKWGLPKYCIL